MRNHHYPCNETQFTPGKDRTRISYRFVSVDGNTPSECTVRLGDMDPLTGEAITDMEFFRQYYRTVDREVRCNLKNLRPDYTEEENAWRENEKTTFTAAFKAEHGYAPSRDDILFHLKQKERERYNLSIDSLVNEDGESMADFRSEFGQRDKDPFGADLPDDIYALKEFADTLTGRKKDVYEAMLRNLSGCKKTTNIELARIWGVSEARIRQDQKLIMKWIQEKLKK